VDAGNLLYPSAAKRLRVLIQQESAMAKILLPDIASQFASQEALNDRFNEIERQFNDNVLYRDNPASEPNEMRNDLDMNLNDIINIQSLIVDGVDLAEAVRAPTAPDSEWGDGINNPVTAIRFKQMDGEWGEWEDIRGYQGLKGDDGDDGGGSSPLTNPSFTYTNGLLTSVEYDDNITKTLTYTGDLLTAVSVDDGAGSVTTKTLNYTNGVLTSITES
tara:strand:+ start:173 stop:826 length:654 start_codon:yes stop_codon:yes gene_type:complete